jgi:ribose 5-phosphate isomerase B
MRIALGADHAGFALKERLKEHLQTTGHEVEDCGTFSEDRSDYPDAAARVGEVVARGGADRGVLVCGTGIGMAIAANKIPGIRAANCNDLFMVGLARAHNDANVLTVGSRVVATEHAEAIVEAFLETGFDGGRHLDRLKKIAALEPRRSG